MDGTKIDDYAPRKSCLTCRHFHDPAFINRPFWGAVMVRCWCESRQEKVRTTMAENCQAYLEKLFKNNKKEE